MATRGHHGAAALPRGGALRGDAPLGAAFALRRREVACHGAPR